MSSQHPPPKRTTQIEYEVSHHQNCGQDRLLITSLGLAATLGDAQRLAQGVLRRILGQYAARGWSGCYCSAIDLDFRGLVAGLAHDSQHVYLSEVQIHARHVAGRTVDAGYDGFGCDTTPGTYAALAPTATLTPWRPAPAYTYPQPQPQLHPQASNARRRPRLPRKRNSFAQTRPPYPFRPARFTPRTSAPYDETTRFSPRHPSAPNKRVAARPASAHRRANKRQQGSSPGGAHGIGAPYLGRRHSSIETKSGNGPFRHTGGGY